MIKILHIVGARPNFMKAAPLMRAMATQGGQFSQTLIHTGQHYDKNMSQVFFDELDLPKPDVNLEVGSGTHAQQTAQVMMRFEPVVLEHRPDWVVVFGDVNSTIACALVCAKLGVKVAHVEAGLRSFDRTMPEELNRLLTDQLADLLFTPSPDADTNLRREGIPEERIHFVGNVMIDSLLHLLPKAEQRWPAQRDRLNLGDFILVTMHRPCNVDDPVTLAGIWEALIELSNQITVVFPVHPRTRHQLAQHGRLQETSTKLHLLDPLSYLDFLALEKNAKLVLTDSGGVQEETTYLGIPCLTARPNTERPVTITHGTNALVVSRRDAIVDATCKLLDKECIDRQAARPPLWDGRATERITTILGSIN